MNTPQLELHGHHYIDRSVMDEDGLPYKHLDDPRINDGPLPADWVDTSKMTPEEYLNYRPF